MSGFVPTRPFKPIPALANPHAQTILGQFLRPLHAPEVRRERWETPDGDFLDVDLLDSPGKQADAPHLLILHGLEGSSKSGYVLAMLRHAKERGWGALAMNFRSCSGVPNRIARSYSSGETADPLFALGKLRESGVTGPLIAVGFSLGGNVVLKLLAEGGDASPLAAAVAVSTPYNLLACANALDAAGGVRFLYREVFMRALKAKALQKARIHIGALDSTRIRAARGIQQFDDVVTAPLYGFRDAEDYYTRCSSGPRLSEIRRPTLLISSVDDPIAPLNGEQQASRSNPALDWVVTPQGGHVGFISGELGAPHFWAEATGTDFLEHALRRSA